MKAIIWIIILLLVGFGLWWFMGEPDVVPTADSASGVVEVQAEEEIDLGEFQDKG